MHTCTSKFVVLSSIVFFSYRKTAKFQMLDFERKTDMHISDLSEVQQPNCKRMSKVTFLSSTVLKRLQKRCKSDSLIQVKDIDAILI